MKVIYVIDNIENVEKKKAIKIKSLWLSVPTVIVGAEYYTALVSGIF